MINLDIKQLKKKGRKWVWIFFGLLLLNVFVLLCGILLKVQLIYIFAFLFLINGSLYILSTFIILFVFDDFSKNTKEVVSLSEKLITCQRIASLEVIFSFLAITFYFISWKISSILLSWTIINSSILINKLGKMSKILEEKEITQETKEISPKPYGKYQKPSKKLRMYRKGAILEMVLSFLAIVFLFTARQISLVLLLLIFIINITLTDKLKKLKKNLEEKEMTQETIEINPKPYLSLPRRKNNLMNNLIKINTWSKAIATFWALLFYALSFR